MPTSSPPVAPSFVQGRPTFHPRRLRCSTGRRRGARGGARARREVILCAGSINTPHLLNLSGIGDAAHLQALGIGVRHHLPEVGRNLHDHYVAKVVRRIRAKTPLNEQGQGPGPWLEALRYLFLGKGVLTCSAACATGYIRSSPELAEPDLQLSFTPGSFAPGGRFALDSASGMSLGA